jgi:DNA-binding MarR family transcriptional regulator
MTHLLDQMEAAGLVSRNPDPDDRRLRQVSIAPKGRRELAKFARRLAEQDKRLPAALDPVEWVQFREMIDRVARAAQGDGPGTPADGPDCAGD